MANTSIWTLNIHEKKGVDNLELDLQTILY